MQLRGSIHMQIMIDFHSARQSGEQQYGSQVSISLLSPACSNYSTATSSLCFFGSRSTRAEADRPDPAQTDPHCSHHLHTRGGQTERRQVDDKVGEGRVIVSCLQHRLVADFSEKAH